ncbi:unnamed protein product, partial [Ectocarpus sp. 4 AP-2014]
RDLWAIWGGAGAGQEGAANVPLPGILSPGPRGIYHPQSSTATRPPFSPGPSGEFGSPHAEKAISAGPTTHIDPIFRFDASGSNGSTHDEAAYDRAGFNRDGINRRGYDRSGLKAASGGGGSVRDDLPSTPVAQAPGNSASGSACASGSEGDPYLEAFMKCTSACVPFKFGTVKLFRAWRGTYESLKTTRGGRTSFEAI